MYGRKISSHLGVTFVYFLILIFLRWKLTFSWEILFFLTGGILGTLLLDLDHFLYVFYTRPEEPSSLEASKIFREKRYGRGILYILEHKEERRELVLHGAIFGPILFILSIFVLTSSGSFFGAGLVLGIFLRYLFDLIDLYKKGGDVFRERFFWQINAAVDLGVCNIFIALLVFGFVFSSALFVR